MPNSYREELQGELNSSFGIDVRNQYPFIQWTGDPRDERVPRGFFLPEDQIPAAVKPYIPDELYSEIQFGDDRTTPVKTGLFFPGLWVLNLSFREDWYIQSQDNPDLAKIYYETQAEAEQHKNRDGIVKSRTRFLVLIKNLAKAIAHLSPDVEVPDAAYGPFIITIKATKGLKLQKVYSDWLRRFLGPLSKADSYEYPYWGFWMPIKAGDPVASSQKFSGTKIVPPVLDMPERLPDLAKAAENLYPGKYVKELAKRYLPEAQEWATATPVGQFGEPATAKVRGQMAEPPVRDGHGEQEDGGRVAAPPFRRDAGRGATPVRPQRPAVDDDDIDW